MLAVTKSGNFLWFNGLYDSQRRSRALHGCLASFLLKVIKENITKENKRRVPSSSLFFWINIVFCLRSRQEEEFTRALEFPAGEEVESLQPQDVLDFQEQHCRCRLQPGFSFRFSSHRFQRKYLAGVDNRLRQGPQPRGLVLGTRSHQGSIRDKATHWTAWV